jgi:transcriptional regulator with PAS, ATPase and Fis domain
MGLGASPKMQAIARQVELLARSDQATVLLSGESGTGKGWVANLIHTQSARARKPFVEINCAGLSAAFLDSELFGHEKGAFTDAKSMKRGLFEMANGGTLFLDEIGDLAPELQPKLLKVLESKSFRRLGGTVEHHADARLIAATNKSLEHEMAAGKFREDLFYRLNVLPLRLPAVRERATEDVLGLVHGMLRELADRHPRGAARISDAALSALVRYDWPGNVRQMRNVLERALVISSGAAEIGVEHLPQELRAFEGPESTPGQRFAGMTLKEVERRHIEHTLIAFGGNRTQAAAALGISRATLHNKIREYGQEQVGRGDQGGYRLTA